MKTTVVINDDLLQHVVKATGVKTKREAIELALKELLRQKNLEAFREELGTYDLDLSLEELENLTHNKERLYQELRPENG